MDRFSRFMRGRYGLDVLGNFLLLLSAVLFLISLFIPVGFIRLAFYLPAIYCLFRAFSKNIDRRRMELYRFEKYRNLTVYRLKNFRARREEGKTHRRFSCPQCRQSVRVPRFRGKIEIICPKCKTKFIKKT